jgi:N-acetylneuraminate synthase
MAMKKELPKPWKARIGARDVGDNCPCYVLAEIGINHNGDIDVAKKLIDVAAFAGCDAVKFQKRTPDLCVPENQKGIERDTPWGRMTYLAYRHKVEFGRAQYDEIDAYCRTKGITWTASCWDTTALEFLAPYRLPLIKVPSALLTDHALIKATRDTGTFVLLSTGMSTWEEISAAASVLGDGNNWMMMHCTSTYPAKNEEINLRALSSLRDALGRPVGYSGHEVGLQVSVAAVALGACMLERHITIDRAMWGTDQAASIEPQGVLRLVRDVRAVESAMGDGVKKVYDSEIPIRAKLRRK